jgi:AAA+ superfamily predicted ATPase
LKGINRKTPGAFAKNEAGELFLVHRGKLGGKRPEYSFKKHVMKERLQVVVDGDRETEVIIIGNVNAKDFLENVKTIIEDSAKLISKEQGSKDIAHITTIILPDGINPHLSQNIILYGPPGTGKTYITREIAEKIIAGKRADAK